MLSVSVPKTKGVPSASEQAKPKVDSKEKDAKKGSSLSTFDVSLATTSYCVASLLVNV